ncbi:unnamed protein product [marine sediment metagenome]|uniref:GAF domain-containing protein n=1 Tax=marine sediment metagenome TaxID=412755 RepID=X1AI56_9ZZZZ
MEDNLETEPIVEFLKLLSNGDLLDSRTKTIMIQRACRAIKNALDPASILVNYYDHENQLLKPLCILEESTIPKNLEIEMDAFDSENPYTDVFAQADIGWFSVEGIADEQDFKVLLRSQNVSDFIICPMYFGDITVGTISVFLYPNTIKHFF